MQRQRWILLLILALVVGAISVLITMSQNGTKFPIPLGLDLRGGAQLTIQVKTTPEIKQITPKELEAVLGVIENRVNGLGVSEAVVQSVGSDQILVQLPGVSDPQQAERVLGVTAQLDFRKQKPGTDYYQVMAKLQEREALVQQQAQLQKAGDAKAFADNKAAIEVVNNAIAELFEPTGLTGKNLKDALPEPTQTSDNWKVAIRFDGTGAEKFAQLTKELAGTGRTIGIFLDKALISAPTVGPEYAQAGITGGGAEITGRYTLQSANEFAVQLRGGALPVPIEIVENRTVGATLGQDSVRSSIYAGIGGLVLVLVFMGIYYRLPGVIADIALVIYALLTLAAFAILGVTLTLPGIAGFILSIGMAVDANVLIFERTREELLAGKTLYRSVESGFYRAFSSILDGNVTTVIACAALFWLGSGLVKGFALTLGLGVMMSMFTAITCSRTFMLLLVLGFPGLRQKPELFVPNPPASIKS